MAKEIVIPRAGGPDVFEARTKPPRAVGGGEVRVSVAAAGVNFADVSGRMGTYPGAPPIPYAPGYEVSGIVTEVGPGVERLLPGDAVSALVRFGGYADEVVVRADQAFRVPEGVDLVDAAGIPVTYSTAHVCLFAAGGLRDGRSVLILGGAGGVGTAAIQLARRVDAKVIAAAGGEAKCAWLREQGVSRAIDHTREDIVEAVRGATGGRGVDLVLDPVGGRGMAKSVACLAPLGRVVLFGASAANPGTRRNLWAIAREVLPMRFFNAIALIMKNAGIQGVDMLHLSEADRTLFLRVMEDVVDGVAKGELTPVIAARFPLTAKGAADAHRYLHDRRNIGKVLLVAEESRVSQPLTS